MFRSALTAGRRFVSTSRVVFNEGASDSKVEKAFRFLGGQVENSQHQEVNIKYNPILPSYVKSFETDQIYDPFDFSLAKIALDRKKARASVSKRTFDEKRLNPLDFYTNSRYLSRYLTSTGRILSRDVTKLSLKNQKRLAKAVKRARSAGLLSSVHQDVTELVFNNDDRK